MIERGGRPAGRLYVDRWAREHRIVDIALAPQHCGQGLGTALRLYRRLGFAAIEDRGVYDLMRWPADQVNNAS